MKRRESAAPSGRARPAAQGSLDGPLSPRGCPAPLQPGLFLLAVVGALSAIHCGKPKAPSLLRDRTVPRALGEGRGHILRALPSDFLLLASPPFSLQTTPPTPHPGAQVPGGSRGFIYLPVCWARQLPSALRCVAEVRSGCGSQLRRSPITPCATTTASTRPLSSPLASRLPLGNGVGLDRTPLKGEEGGRKTA